MKFMLTLALCLALLSSCALGEALPLTLEDLEPIINGEFRTLGDYHAAFSPTGYSWYFEGEATGVTVFTLEVDGGILSLGVDDAKRYQDDEQGLVGAPSIDADVLLKEATVISVYWDDPSFDKIPLPRGLMLGDGKQQMQERIGALEFASLEPGEYEEDYDETASCVLTVSHEGTDWQTYYSFDFFLNQGLLAQVQMLFYTDAE